MSWHLLSPDGRPPTGLLEEVQGLEGAYSFPERLLQKIWLRGNFDRAGLVALDGRRVHLRSPGRWNLLGGPDFRDARLSFDRGPEITGDIELHLRAEGWAAHRHAEDRAYDRVVLHVVLFPPPPDHVTRDRRGAAIPVVTLLPLLDHDLEQFAAEEAVEMLARRPVSRLQEELATLPAEEVPRLLRRHAEARWRQKVRFAGIRIQRLGWSDACHHAALEVLGYRFNRAPMLRVAGAWPLEAWSRGRVGVDEVFAATGGWSVQGIRPANHPRLRLHQYGHWARSAPHWPERLSEIMAGCAGPSAAVSTRVFREKAELRKLRESFAAVGRGVVSGPRLDNLVCDAFLPLLSSRTGRDFSGPWFHWYPGDLPPVLNHSLRMSGVIGAKTQPANHGLAQGLMGWMIERERQ
jgi:hypothetical protein